MSTFVTVGNRKEPFYRLLSAVSQVGSILPQPIIVQHGHTQFNDERFNCFDFIDGDNFVSCIKEASLIVSHGGAGSIMNCLLNSRKPLIVPRLSSFGEIVDDQQLELSRCLCEQNKIFLCEDGDLSAFFSCASPGELACNDFGLSSASDTLASRKLFSDLLSCLIEP
jgi:UDP-N-acetylglucosamine transferase subunit ALG13